MKINRALYQEGKKYHLSEDVDFSSYELDKSIIREIKSCHVEVDIENYGDLFRIIVNLMSEVTLISAYTLKDVPYVIKGNEEFDFTDIEEEADNESLFYEKDNIIDFDPYIYSIILALVPEKVINKGEKLPSDGNGYRVLTEEEYLKEKENSTDPRWSALDDLDL